MGLRLQGRSSLRRWCSYSTSSAPQAAPDLGAPSPGAFREFLRGNEAGSNGSGSPSNTKLDKISSGALHLVPMPNGPRFKPYRSPETIPEFFAKMRAAIKVGGVLRDKGWTRESQRELENLRVAWTPLVVTQVLRQPVDKGSAWNFFQWLKGPTVEGYRHTQYTYNTMIEVFGRAKDVNGIQMVLDDMTAYGCGMNVVIFTTVIYWYHQAEDLDKALGMWNQMVKVGCQPNVVTYTMLMSLLSSVKRYDKVGEMFRDMLNAGVKPNVRTYNILLKCLASAGHTDAALQLFEKMPSLRASPTATTFTVMMEAAASVGDVELVGKLYQEMRRVKRRPNSKTYFAVMESLGKSGKLEEAAGVLGDMERVVSECEKLKLVPVAGGEEGDPGGDTGPLQDMEVMEGEDRSLVDMKAFSTVLLRWGADTPAALEAANFRWDPWKVLRVLMGLRDPYVALKFFYWVEKQPGYKHDSFVCTKMISILTRTEHFKHLDDLLERMQREGVEISLVTMNSLIETLAAANKPWHALKMYYWMKQGMAVEPDARTYTSLIDMLAKSSDAKRREKALEMYREMVDSGCRPDSHTYTVIVQLLLDEGKVDAAVHVFESMPSYGCRPSVITYTSLIQWFAEAGMVSRAWTLFNRMRQQDGIKPNWLTLKAMGAGLRRAGMLPELSELDKITAASDLWWNMDRKSVDQMVVHDTIVNCLLQQNEL